MPRQWPWHYAVVCTSALGLFAASWGIPAEDDLAPNDRTAAPTLVGA